jgi:outer membrane protein OmpA-like peptidoglycan-associated protein
LQRKISEGLSKMTNAQVSARILFPRQLAMIALASAIAIPLAAQQPAGDSQQPAVQSQSSTSSSTAQQQTGSKLTNDSKEGFWGRVNPMARKKWVNKRIDPLKDRLSELDELNAKNARDIQDVDSRAQAGIHKSQSTADAANQTATAAGDQAQKANAVAMDATGHVAKIGETVNGLDQYKPVTELDVTFRGGRPMLSEDARKQLDDMAANLTGHKGYIVEIDGHAPGAGSVGIQNSARLTDTVKRYFVTEHQIPVYRLHTLALGNVAPTAPGDDPNAKPARVKTSTVHIRLMENSLAAQGTAPPHDASSLNGAERP